MAENNFYSGTVVSYSDKYGYGYIKSKEPKIKNDQILFHRKSLLNYSDVYQKGDRVLFKLKEVPRGLLAILVHLDFGPYEETIKEVIAEPKDNILAQATLARDQRQYEKAVKLYELGMAKDPSPQLVSSYAAMAKNRNQKPKALDLYKRGIKLFPNNVNLLESYGLLAANMGMNEKAIELLNTALRVSEEKNKNTFAIIRGLALTHLRIGGNNHLNKVTHYYEELKKISSGPYRDVDFDLAHIRLQHYRGKLAYSFLNQAGFEFVMADLLENKTVGADIVVKISNQEIVGSYGISGNILVRCYFKSEITRNDINDIDGILSSYEKQGILDESVSFVILSSLPDDLQRHLAQRIEDRNRTSPAVIPFPQSDIETNRNAIDAMRSILDRWLYRRDLFASNFPVVGKKFFGREKPLAQMRDSINNSVPAGIFGLRKVGKTSLLKETERRSLEAGDIVLNIDLSRVPSGINDARWLYWSIADKLRDRIDNMPIRVSKWRLGGVYEHYLDIPEKFPVPAAFDADLTKVLKLVKKSRINPLPKVVLLFDEIERIIPIDIGRPGFEGFFELFSYLRGVSQESKEFVFIITGANSAICDKAQFNGKDNPVFNYFQEIYLQFLEPSETTLMIQSLGRGMGLRFPETTCMKIYDLTGGHPFITRQFCSYLASENINRPLNVDTEMVSSSASHYVRLFTKDFDEIIKRLSRDYPEEYKICLYLAEASAAVHIDEIIKMFNIDNDDIRHLIGYQIIKIENGYANLSIEMMKRWLRKFQNND